MKKLTLFVAILTFSAPAFAYLDPGSGSAILSALIGGAVAIGMAVKSYWYKLKSLFSRKPSSSDSPKESN